MMTTILAFIVISSVLLNSNFINCETVKENSDNSPPNSPELQTPETTNSRHILVFGGNGMLGSSTVGRLISAGYNVTIVNRGNWYWDSQQRILPHVRTVSCDRKNNVTSCQLLTTIVQQMIANKERFSAVLDFSAYVPQDITDAMKLLRKEVVDLYIYISTDSVYDVSDPSGHKGHEGPWYGCREEESVRPTDPYLKDLLAGHHEYGHRKLQAEEALIDQRQNENGTHIPYVILRLPDVLGPRDTTYRFWIYQMWIKLAQVLAEHPVTIPEFLVNYNNSFVFVEDVSSLIVDTIMARNGDENVMDQIFNVAWPQNITLQTLIENIAGELKLDGELNLKIVNGTNSVYLYPTVRRGPISTEKVTRMLGWKPTEWKEAIKQTVGFYEEVMTGGKFNTQRDEIIQVLTGNLFHDNTVEMYNTVEKLYGISLQHFKPKDEL